MSTTASKKAFNNAENKVRRESHKERILNFLKAEHWFYSNRKIAEATGLTYEQVHKRTPELVSEQKVSIVGETTENGQTVSLYAYNGIQPLIAVKKLTLKEWLKINHPEVLNEWENLNK